MEKTNNKSEDIVQRIIYEKLSGKLPMNEPKNPRNIELTEEDMDGMYWAGRLMNLSSDTSLTRWEIQSLVDQQRMYNELVSHAFKKLLVRINELEDRNQVLCKKLSQIQR